MTDKAQNRVPNAPELQPADVREELHQSQVSHQGDQQTPTPGLASAHLGATDDEVAPVMPPMRGPGNLVGASGSGDSADPPEDEEMFDPIDEITPG